MDPVTATTRLGGVASFAELLKIGTSKRAIARAVDERRLLRLRRGWYATTDADALDVIEATTGGTRTCVTAVRALGLPLMTDDGRLHLAFADGAHLSESTLAMSNLVRHRFRDVPDARGRAVAAVDSSARCLSRLEQLIVVDAALARGMIAVADIAQFTVTPQRRRRWLARHCDPRAGSIIETVARVTLRAAGYAVEPQARVPGVGRVDLLVEGRVIVELDGRDYHSDATAFSNDRRRDRTAQLQRFVVLRYTYADVIHRPMAIVEDVRAALSRWDLD